MTAPEDRRPPPGQGRDVGSWGHVSPSAASPPQETEGQGDVAGPDGRASGLGRGPAPRSGARRGDADHPGRPSGGPISGHPAEGLPPGAPAHRSLGAWPRGDRERVELPGAETDELRRDAGERRWLHPGVSPLQHRPLHPGERCCRRCAARTARGVVARATERDRPHRVQHGWARRTERPAARNRSFGALGAGWSGTRCTLAFHILARRSNGPGAWGPPCSGRCPTPGPGSSEGWPTSGAPE